MPVVESLGSRRSGGMVEVKGNEFNPINGSPVARKCHDRLPATRIVTQRSDVLRVSENLSLLISGNFRFRNKGIENN